MNLAETIFEGEWKMVRNAERWHEENLQRVKDLEFVNASEEEIEDAMVYVRASGEFIARLRNDLGLDDAPTPPPPPV